MQNPKGKLISIGGAEDKGTDLELGVIERNNLKFFEMGILKRFIKEVGRLDARIEVVTTASSIPVEVGENYLNALTKIGCTNVGVIDVRERRQAMDPNTVQRLRDCDALMFSGGNQLRLTAIFGGTEFLALLKQRYKNENFVIAGTSAGAMAMSEFMVAGGSASEAFYKGAVQMKTGLGFIPELIIDTHFVRRGRFGRLAEAVAINPTCVGIGLAEDTGVIIEGGDHFKVIGSGMAIVMDPRSVTHNNHQLLKEGTLMSMTNLTTHLLANGDKFRLADHSVEVLPMGQSFI